MSNPDHYVIIMAGGVGTRFWPMSRRPFPKQFHDILGTGRSLIQATYDRFAGFIPPENIYVVTNDIYYDLVKTQLPDMADDQILLEPVGRNTAPCVAYACYKISQKNPNASYVVSPADHLISKEETFVNRIKMGLKAVSERNIIMTIGIEPTRPDTGYGYIQYIEEDTDDGYHKVNTFTEKPKLEIAKQFLESGDYLWNGGIFLFSGKTILQAFRDYLPDMADLFSSISDAYYSKEEKEAVGRVYEMCKPISMDYGIMEKADKANIVFTIPADLGWSDLGTWGSVHANSERDERENATYGQVWLYSAENNIVHTSNKKKIVVVNGVQNLIIVDTEDALLVCNKEDEQFIKQIVNDLKEHEDGKYI
jgi:mannose-1-phosphate guanylyltransferase